MKKCSNWKTDTRSSSSAEISVSSGSWCITRATITGNTAKKKNNKNSYSKISKLMITLRLRERLGRCCGKLNHGDCSGTLPLLLSVSTRLRKRLSQSSSLQTVPRSGNQHIEPSQSQVYSWTSTNGHLSTTAIFFCPEVAVVESFNCKFKISGQ